MSSYREVLRDGFEIRNFIEQTLLRFQIGDIDCMNEVDLNAGYPIVLLIMSCIEVLSRLIMGKNGGDAVESFFNEYMVRVNPLYGLEFNAIYKKKEPVKYFSLGRILYLYNRNWLTHSSGPLNGLPIDAREELREYHLAMQINGSILIHGYQFYDDFRNALVYFYEDLDANPEFLTNVVDRIMQFINHVDKDSRHLHKLISSQIRLPGSAIWIDYPKARPV